MYVIHKFSRVPTNESYKGPTWDKANIRSLYKTQFESKEEAELLALALSYENPVGFTVSEV